MSSRIRSDKNVKGSDGNGHAVVCNLEAKRLDYFAELLVINGQAVMREVGEHEAGAVVRKSHFLKTLTATLVCSQIHMGVLFDMISRSARAVKGDKAEFLSPPSEVFPGLLREKVGIVTVEYGPVTVLKEIDIGVSGGVVRLKSGDRNAADLKGLEGSNCMNLQAVTAALHGIGKASLNVLATVEREALVVLTLMCVALFEHIHLPREGVVSVNVGYKAVVYTAEVDAVLCAVGEGVAGEVYEEVTVKDSLRTGAKLSFASFSCLKAGLASAEQSGNAFGCRCS